MRNFHVGLSLSDVFSLGLSVGASVRELQLIQFGDLSHNRLHPRNVIFGLEAKLHGPE
jgi:hypothetical protein